MSNSENVEITKTEHEIAHLLSRLEKTTGQIIQNIEIVGIEMTRIEDVRPQWLRRVQITLKRLPGTQWEGVE